MNQEREIRKKLREIDAESFDSLAMDVFRWQARQNPVYASYLRYLGLKLRDIRCIEDIPFLPVPAFRFHRVISGTRPVECSFVSSSTSGSIPAHHHVSDLSLYRESLLRAFRKFYGDPGKYRIFPLLPSYLEREDASLVYMVKVLMEAGKQNEEQFYLHNYEKLAEDLQAHDRGKRKILFIGDTFALLRFASKYPMDLNDAVIMETGGMKGRGRELTREEVHERLKSAFGVASVHSEYGMTEMLSQAYSAGEGLFEPAPTMKVSLRDIHDPFEPKAAGETGVIRVIDLANLYSCSFLETADLGKVHADGRFEVLGRMDHSEVRGCNLMAGL